jgi:hypothetical protein
LTGQPLVLSELVDAPDVKAQVQQFFEKPKPQVNAGKGAEEEDLYDF